ncbi:MAG: TAT-variant-translocated molybdopterin oxidoreductase [Phycisphaerales bacterium]
MPQVNDNTTGSAYWRSLEEYSSAPEVREMLKQEFAGYDPDDVLAVSRRRFVQIMAASLSLAGLTLSGCRRWPQEKLAPFASRPAGSTPGVPTHYASMIERGGIANGVLVNSFDGRPIKVEGNPLHPGSLGATDAFTQASVLQMYDPYRLREVKKGKDAGTRSNWAGYKTFSDELVAKIKSDPASFAVLSECSSSPSLKRMKDGLLAAFPGSMWFEYEPLNRDNEIQGARLAFEKPVRAQYHLDKAETIVCFDSDLLGSHPNQVRHAHDWALGRKSADEGRMNRLYAVESTMSITGSVADHRLPIRSAKVGAIVQAVAQHLKLMPGSSSLNGSSVFVETLIKDLERSRGKSLVVAGPGQPPEVHALCWAINDALGNIGNTVEVTEEPEVLGGSNAGCFRDIAELAGAIESGQVKHLLILGGNAAYDAPADLDFAGKLAKLESAVHLTEYSNETSKLCSWQLPRANYLECWGDGRSWDGTLSVQQPLILPIARKGSESKSPIELIAAMLGESATDGYTIVRQTLAQVLPTVGFEAAWRKTLHEGLVEGSAYAPLTARPKKANLPAPPLAETQGYELTFQADPSVYDGRYADNGWLQELPGPMTKMTWDNAALINIADAKSLGVRQGDLINITLGDKSLKIAAYLMPGQAKGSVALPLGYGRPGAGPVGKLVGFNTYTLRGSERPHFARDAKLAAAGESYELALTQNHHLIDPIGEKLTDYRVGTKSHSGSIIKEADLEHYKKDPAHAWRAEGEHAGVSLQLWDSPYMTPAKREGGPEAFNDPHAWGMTIDMNACIGCNACVVACQAENNVPVVGKDMVLMSREMNWIRIDRYFKNDRANDPDAENPEVIHQPMMCQQCENAPCEQVCPVAATVHDAEGLNVMVYNRCIGTRYCSNNCPYKVRRFNYFDYHSKDPRGMAKPWLLIPDMQQDAVIDKIKRMVYNPDVTMRMRGVMEKCSYCVQRIKRNTIEAKNKWARGEREKPTVDDGAIVTACQQSCPTQAIVFGDLNDADSHVTKSQQSPRAYMVLEELNTRARSKYLAKLRNPNPALASAGGGGHEPSHPASETQEAHS